MQHYIQFVGEDMNVGPAMSKARALANDWFTANPECEILSEQLLSTTTVAQKTVIIILLRIAGVCAV